jgi:hypothetical protein
MLVEDCSPAEIQFGELGYAREARISYQDFLSPQRTLKEIHQTSPLQMKG